MRRRAPLFRGASCCGACESARGAGSLVLV